MDSSGLDFDSLKSLILIGIGINLGTYCLIKLLERLRRKWRKRNDRIREERDHAVENLLENPGLITDVKLDLIHYELLCFIFLLLLTIPLGFFLLNLIFGLKFGIISEMIISAFIIVILLVFLSYLLKALYQRGLIREIRRRHD